MNELNIWYVSLILVASSMRLVSWDRMPTTCSNFPGWTSTWFTTARRRAVHLTAFETATLVTNCIVSEETILPLKKAAARAGICGSWIAVISWSKYFWTALASVVFRFSAMAFVGTFPCGHQFRSSVWPGSWERGSDSLHDPSAWLAATAYVALLGTLAQLFIWNKVKDGKLLSIEHYSVNEMIVWASVLYKAHFVGAKRLYVVHEFWI